MDHRYVIEYMGELCRQLFASDTRERPAPNLGSGGILSSSIKLYWSKVSVNWTNAGMHPSRFQALSKSMMAENGERMKKNLPP